MTTPLHSDPLARPRLALLVAATAAVLAACGGGGEPGASTPSEDASHAASTPADEAAAAAAPTEQPQAIATSTTITATCGLANFQAEALQRINAYRARGASCGGYGYFSPTAALAWHAGPIAASARHSNDMVAKNFFSHTGSDGSNAGTRLTQAGYAWTAWGENIAAGQGSVQAVVDGWMASPGHCANIMRSSYRDVGLACVKGTSTNRYRTYWTMVLGRR